MRHRHPFFSLAVALLAAAGVAAQADAAAVRGRIAAAEQAVAAATQDCLQSLGRVRAAFNDPDNKVERDCGEIEAALRGGSFDPGIGIVPIALDHMDYVAEERREPTRAALAKLLASLEKGQATQQRLESLQELAGRLESLGNLGADDDASLLLADLAASTGKATRTQALARDELAALQQDLAKRRARNEARIGGEQLAEAKQALTQLRADLPAIRTELKSGDGDARRRAGDRLLDGAQTVRTGAARAAVADRAKLLAELDTAIADAETAAARDLAPSLLARIRENWTFSADQFEGWAEEGAEISAQGAIDLDPPNVDVFALPKCVRLVDAAGKWFAFLGQDPEYRRARGDADVAAYVAGIAAMRDQALARLLPAATKVVEGLRAIAIEEDRVRNRMQAIADWEAPMALLLHPAVPELRARVHAMLDAHDRKAAGADRALATIREQALAAADALWPRLQACLPVEGGFEPALSALFVGRTMRLEAVWLRTAEFAAGDHDVVFDLGGHAFAGSFAPGVRDAVRRGRQRLGLPGDGLTADAPCEFWAVVGDDATLSLLGPKGKDDAIAVPARRLRIVAARQGAVFGVAP